MTPGATRVAIAAFGRVYADAHARISRGVAMESEEVVRAIKLGAHLFLSRYSADDRYMIGPPP